jgi:hypothetical protein
MLALMERAGDAMLTCGGCDRCEEIERRWKVRLPRGLPRRLGIYLPSDDLDTVFPTSLAWYRGRRRVCYGDGKTALRTEVTVAGDKVAVGPQREHAPCGATCLEFAERKCKPSAHLNFVLDGQHVVGGFYQFRTSSWASIHAIEGGLQQVQAVAGTIRFVPLVFELVTQRVQPANGAPAGKAQIARLYYPGSYRQLVSEARGALAVVAPQRAEIRRLEATIAHATAEPGPAAEAAIDAEFYQATPEDDLSQIRFDPSTGEVLDEEPVIDRTETRDHGAKHVAPVASGAGDDAPAPEASAEPEDPFAAAPREIEADAARERLTADHARHLSQAMAQAGLATPAKRTTFLRRLAKRNVTDVPDLTLDEYGQACLELGVSATPSVSAEDF